MTRNEWNRRSGRSSSFVRRSLRFAIYARDKFDCVYCRQVFPQDFSGRGLTLDHVIPRKDGGKSTADNLVTCCTRHNSARQDRELKYFICDLDIDGATMRGYGHVMDRVRRALRKPLNRELGRWLAGMASSTRSKFVALTEPRERQYE